jgi:hypothetical protein
MMDRPQAARNRRQRDNDRRSGKEEGAVNERKWAAVAALLAALLAFNSARASAQSAPGSAPAANPAEEQLRWPRVITNPAGTLTVYQPQIEQWNGINISTRAAICLQPSDGSQPIYGVVWMKARADVDKAARVVTFRDFEITKVSFPTAPEKEAAYSDVLRTLLPTGVKTVALDHLEASLAVSEAVKKQQGLDVSNAVPRIFYTTTPTILALVDGPPVFRPMTGLPSVERVLNTYALIVKLQNRLYLTALGFWYQAKEIEGPWTPVPNPPDILDQAKNLAAETKVTDLMEPQPDSAPIMNPPAVRVSTVPAELIQTDGPARMLPIEETDNLLEIQNSDDAIFMNLLDNKFYVLLSGRWFRSASLYGPWEFVPAKSLPEEFAKIPPDHPRANALVSVPGTPQAKEALIANSIPQTAAINRAAAKLVVTYDGPPQFAPIQGTSLLYSLNAQPPVICAGANSFYCVQNGVWFTANTPTGPWTVATSVPPEVYSIPVSSPLHYLTYVYVYDSTPEVVYVGYTPGYLGTCVSSDDTVVYGTGYAYSPWCENTWVGYPWTYGFSAGFSCDSLYGFGFGFAASPRFPGCTPRPWWGPFEWARRHQAGDYNHVRLDHVDIYRLWSNQVAPALSPFAENRWSGRGWSNMPEPFRPYAGRTAMEGRPLRTAANQPLRSPEMRARLPRAETAPSNSVFAGAGGEVFRATPNRNWEALTPRGWQSAGQAPAFRSEAPILNRERSARELGAQRVENWRSSGGFQPQTNFAPPRGPQPGGPQPGGPPPGGGFRGR